MRHGNRGPSVYFCLCRRPLRLRDKWSPAGPHGIPLPSPTVHRIQSSTQMKCELHVPLCYEGLAVDKSASILVYPPSGTGALNINNGDLARLNPDEFLNDTLIEFALKYAHYRPSSHSFIRSRLWLNTLRDQNPTLAEQVHVFNSFFYKKLAVKK